MISKLKEIGIDSIVEDSSGNAGSSIAAYAALAKIHTEIYVPSYASKEKIAQIQAYGARLIKVEGSREETANLARKASVNMYYAGHSINPFFLEGVKTISYEIWEQLNWEAPDNVVLPVGSGTLLLGTYLGFKELMRAKAVSKIPKIFGVQSENCCPIYQSYIKSFEHPLAAQESKITIAEGINVLHPPRKKQIIDAVKETQGTFLTVSEDEILEASRELGYAGFYVEPTSAVALASIPKLLRIGKISEKEITIIPLTGNGLKTTYKTSSWTSMDD